MPRSGEGALPEDRERLQHMLMAAKDAVFFAAGRSRADLGADREIGEAAARQALPDEKGSVIAMGLNRSDASYSRACLFQREL